LLKNSKESISDNNKKSVNLSNFVMKLNNILEDTEHNDKEDEDNNDDK